MELLRGGHLDREDEADVYREEMGRRDKGYGYAYGQEYTRLEGNGRLRGGSSGANSGINSGIKSEAELSEEFALYKLQNLIAVFLVIGVIVMDIFGVQIKGVGATDILTSISRSFIADVLLPLFGKG